MGTKPHDEAGEQSLLPGLRASVAQAKRSTRAAQLRQQQGAAPARVDPVARVWVDVPLAHLDREFDYLVPESMAGSAIPGARVKVRFAGQEVAAWVIERTATSEHAGTLTPLRRVVSPEPVLLPEIADLATALAHRYAGSRSDVLRLAIPPRHARTEQQVPPAAPPASAERDSAALAAAIAVAQPGWRPLEGGAEFLSELAAASAPRMVWNPGPSTDWPARIAELAAVALAAGRGTVICVPDARDLSRVDAALTAALGADQHVCLSAQPGPAKRYAEFLRILRGHVRVVVGTRSAAFAPVRDLGLVLSWDDGDDSYAEPRAPYPRTREVLLTRAEHSGAAVVLGGFARSCEAHQLVRVGWARSVVESRDALRAQVTVTVTEALDRGVGTRLPRAAMAAIRAGLEVGPVLVQTPRSGYASALACERCRSAAICATCSGPLSQPTSTAAPTCGWCGAVELGWACPVCRHRGLRAPVVGESRTAEELGRMFAPTPVVSSAGDRVRASVPARPQIVVSTPGAEPVAEGGYAAVVLLDTWLPLTRVDLRVGEESARRWFNAAALVSQGGQVVAVGEPAQRELQALVRWDPAGYAERELAERSAAHLPPAVRLATITGTVGAVDDVLTLLDLPQPAEILGPVAVSAQLKDQPEGAGRGAEQVEVRAIVRVPRGEGTRLSASLLEVQRVRSARKLEAVRIQVDPFTL